MYYRTFGGNWVRYWEKAFPEPEFVTLGLRPFPSLPNFAIFAFLRTAIGLLDRSAPCACRLPCGGHEAAGAQAAA